MSELLAIGVVISLFVIIVLLVFILGLFYDLRTYSVLILNKQFDILQKISNIENEIIDEDEVRDSVLKAIDEKYSPFDIEEDIYTPTRNNQKQN